MSSKSAKRPGKKNFKGKRDHGSHQASRRERFETGVGNAASGTDMEEEALKKLSLKGTFRKMIVSSFLATKFALKYFLVI